MPGNKYFIFAREAGRRLASEYNIPFLGKIPLVQGIREGGDEGTPVMVSDDLISKAVFREFADNVVRSVSMRNAHINPQKVAEAIDE